MANRKANTFRYINSREMIKKNSQMFCGLALKRIELPQSIFLFTRLDFFAHFFTPKNTLVIVTEILLYIKCTATGRKYV